MELGATVCLPNGEPDCGRCPLAHLCAAHGDNTVLSYPVRKEKRPRRREDMTVLLLCCGQRIALKKRTEDGLLKGMWELPNLPETPSADALKKRFSAESISPLGKKKHIFTHIEWHMTGWKIILSAPLPEYRWVTKEELQEEYALPTAFSKFIP